MLNKKNIVRIILVFLPLLMLSVSVCAQEDTAKVLTEELKDVPVDPMPGPPPAETDEGYGEEEEATVSKYFLNKDLQPNGGGPDSVRQRNIPDTTLARLRKDGAFWYVDEVFEKKKPKPKQGTSGGTPFAQSSFFQTLLWLAIIGGFATFVIIYLSNSNVGMFRKRNRVLKGDAIDEEVETDNIFEINYQREIDRAVAKGNYRFAVRLLFLRVLKTMSEKNIIQYKHDRTNFDYLLQLHPTRHYNDFFRLTRNYEYSWYGQFDIDREKYNVIQHDFENFDNKLK